MYKKYQPGKLKEQADTTSYSPGKPSPITVLSNSVIISWQPPISKPDGFQCYEVKFKTVDEDWESVLSDNTNCQVTLNNLKSETVYHCKVRAICENQEGPFGDLSDDISTLGQMETLHPGKPEKVNSTTCSVEFKWDKPYMTNMDVDFYEIEYKDSNDSFTVWNAQRTDHRDSFYTIEGLAENQSYDVRVRAVIDGKYSAFSDVSTFCTMETVFGTTEMQHQSKTVVPDIQEIAADHSSITLQWEKPASNADLSYFEVRYKKSIGNTKWLSVPTNGPKNNIVINDLEENTKYDFKVRAIFENNDGHFSHPPITLSTRSKFADLEVQSYKSFNKATMPTTPVKIDSTANSMRVHWTFSAQVAGPIDRYEFRYKESDSTCRRWKSQWTENDETVLTVSALQENSSYDCKVRAIFADKDGPFSETIKLSTDKITFGKLSPPEIKESTHCMIFLEWKKPKEGRVDISHYEVRYKVCGTSPKWKSLLTEGPENNIKINNLQPNTVFECKVRAVYGDDDGSFSETANASTKSSVDKSVECTTPVPISIESNNISLRWDPPSNLTYRIDCYEIQYTQLDQGICSSIRTNSNETCLKIKILNCNTKYEFKVCAIINGKPSNFSRSNILKTLDENNTALCLSSPPSELGVTTDSVSLQWRAPRYGKDQINDYEVKYREKKDDTATVKWQTIHTKTNKTYITISQLKPFTNYEFKVRPIFEESVGIFHDQATIVSTKPVSNDPQVPVLKESKHNQLTVQWNQPQNATDLICYELRYKELNTGKWISVQSNKTEESIKNLSSERFYEFKVRAVFNEYEGQFSKTVKFSTLKLDSISSKAELKPGMPEPKYVTDNSLIITWKPPNNTKDLNYFELRYRVNSSVKWKLQSTEQNEVALKDLKENTIYEFKVKTIYEDEEGPYSDTSTLSTQQRQKARRDAQQYQTSAPEDTCVSFDSITINWKPPLDTNGFEYYEVRHKEVSLDKWNYQMISDKTEISFQNLSSSVEYEFKVRAVFDDGHGPFSDANVIKTKDINSAKERFRKMKPGIPKSVRETSSNIYLQWIVEDIDASLVKHYELNFRECNDSGKEWNIITSNGNNQTVSELKAATKYEFKVRAVFQNCESSFSETVKVKTKSCTADQVRQTSATHNSMGISWKSPEYDNEIMCYKVDYKERNSRDWEHVETHGKENRMMLNGLKDSGEYEIRIHTIFSDKDSACSEIFSNFLTQRRPPTKIPGQPKEIDSTSRTITLDWSPCELKNFDCYEIRYRECGTTKSTKWTAIATEVRQHTFKVPDLKSGTDYEFKVAAVVDGESTQFGDISTKIDTKMSLATCIRQNVDILITSGPPARYKLPVQFTSEDGTSKTRKCHLKHEDVLKPQKRESKGVINWFKNKAGFSSKSTTNFKEKTIMLVGATGSGKSTLIDGMINYITDVSWEDDFRFSLIDITQDEKKNVGDETVSQTEWITIYKIPCLLNGNLDYTLNIVDTPGFGDTRGIARDQNINSQMNDLFQSKTNNGILTIDGVCFVTQSPLARLTPTQTYIFDSILSMFGKDIANNMFVLITFADGKTPPVLDALKKAEVPFNSHFKFNNSALFEPNNEQSKDKFAKIFWKMGEQSFKNFFDHLNSVDQKSLVLTAEVLRTRNILGVTIEGLQQQVTDGMNQLNTIRQEGEILKRHRTDIEENKNFDYEVEEVVMTQIPLDQGQYVTNCLMCNDTCHFPCYIADDKDKQSCTAMVDKENCNVCSKKCHWSNHRNAPFRLKALKKKVQKTYQQLKDKYEIAQKEEKSQTAVLDKVKNKFKELKKEVADKLTKVRKCINDLDKSALKPNPLSDIEYIDLLIHSEESQLKFGWQDRVQLLQSFRKEAEVISQAKLGKAPFDDYDSDEILKQFDIK